MILLHFGNITSLSAKAKKFIGSDSRFDGIGMAETRVLKGDVKGNAEKHFSSGR